MQHLWVINYLRVSDFKERGCLHNSVIIVQSYIPNIEIASWMLLVIANFGDSPHSSVMWPYVRLFDFHHRRPNSCVKSGTQLFCEHPLKYYSRITIKVYFSWDTDNIPIRHGTLTDDFPSMFKEISLKYYWQSACSYFGIHVFFTVLRNLSYIQNLFKKVCTQQVFNYLLLIFEQYLIEAVLFHM